MFTRRIVPTLLLLLLVAGAGVAPAKEITLGLVISEPTKRKLDDEMLNAATQAFFNTRRFDLMERTRLDKIIDEKGLQEFIGALTDGGSSSGIEDLEGVDEIGLISYAVEPTRGLDGRYVDSYFISVRMVSVKSGRIMNVVDSRRVGLYEPTTPHQAGEYLFQNVREVYPPEAYVLMLDGKTATISMGADVGLKKGDLLEVVREGTVLFDPEGRALQGPETVLGTLVVSRADAQVSTCKIKKTNGTINIEDTVRLKARDQTGFKVLSKMKKAFNRS